MAWQKGPLPANTWYWGGVMLVGESTYGFQFASFCGDHIKLYPDDMVVKAEDVAWYDNSLKLPLEDFKA